MSAAHEPIRAGARYDRIGRTYSRYRKPDPRIAARIAAAVGTARTIVNVGSGPARTSRAVGGWLPSSRPSR
jgi:hypothetical protein